MRNEIVLIDSATIIGRTDYRALQHKELCNSIIKRYASKASQTIISISDSNEKYAPIEELEKAIRVCKQRKTRIINLSMGSTYWEDYYQIKEVVVEYLCEGGIIVAAHSNVDNSNTYPASMPGVFDVRAGEKMSVDYSDISNAVIYAPSEHIVFIDDVVVCTHKCNSFAAPFVTSYIWNIIAEKENMGLCLIRRELSSRLVCYCPENYYILSEIVPKKVVHVGKWKTSNAFEIVGMIESQKDAESSNELFSQLNGVGLIVHPQKENELIAKYIIEKNKASIFQVIYAGGHSSLLAETCKKLSVFYWEEREYFRSITKTVGDYGEIKCPIIQIYGEENSGMYGSIRDEIQRNSINAMVFSSDNKSYLDGFVFLKT